MILCGEGFYENIRFPADSTVASFLFFSANTDGMSDLLGSAPGSRKNCIWPDVDKPLFQKWRNDTCEIHL
jgi:hypothetical protein